MSERRFPPARLPECFRPKLYACPDPECLYLGSAAEGLYFGNRPFCLRCGGSLGPEDVRVFGPAEGEAAQPEQGDDGLLASLREIHRLTLIVRDKHGSLDFTPSDIQRARDIAAGLIDRLQRAAEREEGDR